MATNACAGSSIYGAPFQHSFLGASVQGFQASLGWNEQVTTVTVNLVEDGCVGPRIFYDGQLNRQSGVQADPGFSEPTAGEPVYFRFESNPLAASADSRGGFEFAGLVQSWTKGNDAQGKDIYTVVISDPRQILENTQVIVGEYAGSVGGVKNVVNAYAFAQTINGKTCLEAPSFRFGGKTNASYFVGNDRGMTWNDVKCAVETLLGSPDVASVGGLYGDFVSGGRLQHTASSNAGQGSIPESQTPNSQSAGYTVDLSEIPFAPNYYRITGPNLSLMELISQVCEDAGCDFFVELLPAKNGSIVNKTIKIRVSQRSNSQTNGIEDFLNQISTDNNGESLAISTEIGQEAANETTSVFLIGAKERIPLVQSNLSMLPYWGVDNNGDLIQATVAGGEYRVRLDVSRLNPSLYTSFASSYIWVSESELRAALGDMDAWKHVSLAQGLGVATHFANIKQTKFISNQKIEQVARGTAPSHTIAVPQIEANSDEMDPSSDSAKDLTKIYDFIKSFADEFYGKQFVVATPDICYTYDSEDGEYIYSHDPSTDGCWVSDGTPQIIGLTHNSSASDFFRSADGKYQTIVRYPVAGSNYAGTASNLVADPSQLGDDNYISNGAYIWQKADIDPKTIFGNPLAPNNGVVGVIVKVGAAVTNRTSDPDDPTKGVDQPQGAADFLSKKAGGAGLKTANLYLDRSAFSMSMIGNAISPDLALVPLTSNVTVYGPWLSTNSATGGTRVEKEDSYAPWEFGSDVLMNLAGQERVDLAASNTTYAERGSVTIVGYPNLSLGDAIGGSYNNSYLEGRSLSLSSCTNEIGFQTISRGTVSDGANVTNISCSIGAQGFTTTYQVSTYTPRFGRFNKDNANRLKRIGKNRLSANRERRARFSVAELVTKKIASIRQRVNDQIGKTARAPKSANHMLMGRILPSGDRTESFTMNVKEASLTFPSDSVYANTAFMSLDGLMRPVSKAGDASLPRFINYTPSTCSGNASSSIAPDGPKISYSGQHINQNFLDPLSNPGQGVSVRDAVGSGHDIEILGRNTSAPPSGFAIIEGEEEGSSGYSDDYRFFAMRGPLMLHGWGYDTAGKPIPNAADNENDASAGTFVDSALQDKFLDGFLKKQKTWPVAPVDLRLDRKRGVWTVPPPPRNLHITPSGCVDGSGKFTATVNNGQTTTDADGNTVDNNVYAEWPWTIQAPSGVGKIPSYYDTNDCKYYAFPVNRFDAEVSGIDGYGIVNETLDVKKIVFASGFSGVFSTGNGSGCNERTLYLRAESLPPKFRWDIWGQCSGPYSNSGLDCGIVGETGCTPVACLSFSTGLVFDGSKVTSLNYGVNVQYSCSGGSFSGTTGECLPWTHLIAGSGLSLTGVSGCDGVKAVRLDANSASITGSELDVCVSSFTRGAKIGGPLGDNKLAFGGFLSTTYDSDNCAYFIDAIQQSLIAKKDAWCGSSYVSEFRFTGINFGRGFSVQDSGCQLAVNSNLRSYGYTIADDCDPDTRTNHGERYHEGFKFIGNLSTTYDDANCIVTVSGVRPTHTFKPTGYLPCSINGFAQTMKTTLIGSGLEYTIHSSPGCTGLLQTDLNAYGYFENQYNCDPWQPASDINFQHRFVNILFGTGFKVGYSTGDCRLHVNSALIGSGSKPAYKSAGGGCGSLPDYNSSRVGLFKKQIHGITVTGALSATFSDVNDYCTMTISGLTTQGIKTAGYTSPCDQTTSTSVNYESSGIAFGKGIRINQDSNCRTVIESPLYFWGSGECSNVELDDVEPIVTTGVRIGSGLRLKVLDPANCTVRLDSNMIISGWDEYLNKDVKKNYTTLVVTGNLALNSPSTPYADDCTVLLSGITPPSIDSGIYIYETGVCGSVNGSENKVTKITYGSGLSVDFRNNSTGIVKLDFKVGGDPSDCFNNSISAYNVTGITFGTGLSVDYDTCGNVHVNSRFYVSGSPDGCSGAYYSKTNPTGFVIGRGLRAIDDGTCATKLRTNIYAIGSSNDTSINVKTRDWDQVQYTGNIRLIDDGCRILVSGYGTNITVTGLSSCGNLVDYYKDDTVSKLGFRKGLFVQDDGAGNPIVDSIFYVEGTTDTVGCGKSFATQNITGLKIGHGLELAAGATSECNLVLRSKLGVEGTSYTNCGDTFQFNEEPYITGFEFRDGLSLTLDGCKAIVSGVPTFTVGGFAGSCGGTDVPAFTITGIQFGTGLLLDDANGDCGARLSLNFKAGGDTSECFTSVSVTENITGITFGTGLKVGADGCNLHVNSRFYVSGDGGVCGGTYADGQVTSGIVIGGGLKTTNSSCVSNIELNFLASQSGVCGAGAGASSAISSMIYGTGLTFSANGCTGVLQSNITADGSTYSNPCSVGSRSNTFTNKRFQNIEFAGYLNSAINGCDLIVSGSKSPINIGSDGALFESVALVAGSGIEISQSGTCSGVINAKPISVTGSSNPCTLGKDVNGAALGITFGSGLVTSTDGAGGFSVDSPFYLSGDGGACRGTYYSQANTSGIVIGAGLKASSDASCATLIETNIFASGAVGRGQSLQKIPFNAIVFDNKTLGVKSAGDGCTVTVSGLPMAATGSSNPCTPANDTTTDGLDGLVFGTGLKTTKIGNSLHVNSPFYVSGDGSVCGGTWATAEVVSGIKIGKGLKATNSSCVSSIELNFNAGQAAKCAGGGGSVGQVSSLIFGTGLNYSASGCTGIIISDIKANGSEFSDPCSVGSRTNAFSNKRFENITFNGYLASVINGCDITVSGRKSPINVGNSEAGLFEAINILAGSGVDIQGSGSCNAVISVTAGNISGIGSSDQCTDSRDVQIGSLAKIVFGTGLRTSAAGDTLLVDSPFHVIGEQSCNSTAYARSLSKELAFGRGLQVTGSGSCGQKVESNIIASGDGGGAIFDKLIFAGNLSTTVDNCDVTVSGVGPTISGDGSCGGTPTSVPDGSTIVFSTGLAVSTDGDGNPLVASTLKAQGRPITDACSVPPTEGASFNKAFSNISFTGYLSATQDDNCNVVVEGVRSPITISKSGTFCGTDSSESGNVTNINLSSGIDLTIGGCSATLSTNMKVGGAAACGRSAVTPGKFTTLEFGSGLVVNKKVGEDCTWQVNSNFSVEGREDCGYSSTITANTEKLVFGEGLTMTDDGGCQVTISSVKRIGGAGSNGCIGTVAAAAPFETLMVSGLGLSVNGCTATISGPKMQISDDGSCGFPSVSPVPFTTLELSTGLRFEMDGCTAKIGAGIMIDYDATDCNNGGALVNGRYHSKLIVGAGLNATAGADCSVKIDAGLSGVRSGSFIRGQSVNCGAPSNDVLTAGLCTSNGDQVQTNRGIPERIRGIYTGPGIGATIGDSVNCESDTLILFANNAVSGINNGCEDQLGLQVYTTKYSNAFAIGGTAGLDQSTAGTVDGSTFAHGTAVYLNEGGGSWSCVVVTGIEVTKDGPYVTNVTPLNGYFAGTRTCPAGGAVSETPKFWVTSVPCV
jgi:hypothetical protein